MHKSDSRDGIDEIFLQIFIGSSSNYKSLDKRFISWLFFWRKYLYNEAYYFVHDPK